MSLFKKAISLIVAFSFIFSSISFAAPVETPKPGPSKEAVTDLNVIVVQKDYGLIKSKFIGNSGKLIIHIQDAHCNFEAQSNIVKILENLIKNDNITLVSVEGADGVIDTSWFKAFPDEEIRREVATYFMKKGEITGPEFLSITTDLPIKLYGAETRSYYIDNLNAFTSSYPLKDATEKYYNQIKSVLNRLKGYIYNDDLKLVDSKIEDYEAKKIQFNDYTRFLESMAAKCRINTRAYENLFKLISVLVYEKKIDFNVVDKERAAVIDALSKKLPKEGLTGLVNKSLEFKTGKISSVEFYASLRGLAMKNDIDISRDYQNLYNYIIYNGVYSRIENEKLFNDIKKIESAIKEKLFRNDDQRTLDRLYRHVNILLNLINIKLMNGDFDYYKNHKDEFTHEAFTGFIRKKTAQYGLAYEIEPPSEAVEKSVPKLEDFYIIATKRDRALIDNTLKAMDKENTKTAVLITGGFHSEGMMKMLEKQGISYVVVCPSITKDAPSPYIQILTNQRTSFEDILVGASETKQGMVAPWNASQLVKLAHEQPDEFRRKIAAAVKPVNGQGLAEREAAIESDVEHIARLLQEAIDAFGAPSETMAADLYANEIFARVLCMLGVDEAKLKKIEAREKDIAARTRELQRQLAAKAKDTPGAQATGPKETPGKGAVRTRKIQEVYEPLTDEQIDALHEIYRKLIREGRMRSVVIEGITFQHYLGLEREIELHNIQAMREGRYKRIIPLDYKVHPGRGGEELNHLGRLAHLSEAQFLGSQEKGILNDVARHELGHIVKPDVSPEELAEYEETLDENMRSILYEVEKNRLREDVKQAASLARSGDSINFISEILEARLIELIVFGDALFLADALTLIGEYVDANPDKHEVMKDAIISLSNIYPIWAADWLDRALNMINAQKAKARIEEIIEKAGVRTVNDDDIKVVILAGGGGTRVWPYSTEETPKPLLQFRKGADRSLLQETVWRLTKNKFIGASRIYIQTIPALRDKIIAQVTQLGIPADNILTEPAMADSCAAIGYAACHIAKANPDATMVVLTADHIIGQYDAGKIANLDKQDDFWKSIYELVRMAQGQPYIGTIGIHPTRPAPKEFGHLRKGKPAKNVDGIYGLDAFIEKPDNPLATELYKKGYEEPKTVKEKIIFWNSGMFVFDVKTIFDAFKAFTPQYYEGLEEISRDIGTEKEKETEERVFARFKKWKQEGLKGSDGRTLVERGKNSIDFLVMEPAGRGESPRIRVVGAFEWDYPWYDVGNLGHAIRDVNKTARDDSGNLTLGEGDAILEKTTNATIMASQGVNVRAYGVENMSVICTKKAVLILPFEKSQDIKKLLDELADRGLDGYTKSPTHAGSKRLFTIDHTGDKNNRYIYMPGGDAVSLDCRDTTLVSNNGIVSAIGLHDVTVIRNGNNVYIFGSGFNTQANMHIQAVKSESLANDKNKKGITQEERLQDVHDILMRRDIPYLSPEYYAKLYDLDHDVADRELLGMLCSLEHQERIIEVDKDGFPAKVDPLAGIMATYLPKRVGDKDVPDTEKGMVAMRGVIQEIAFGSYDLRGKADLLYPDWVCFTLGRVLGEKLLKEFGAEEDIWVLAAREVRRSGKRMQEAFIRGLIITGINVYRVSGEGADGFLSTPEFYFGCVLLPNVKAGSMNTASHNPPDENGFKFDILLGRPNVNPKGFMESPSKDFVSNKNIEISMKAMALERRGFNYMVRMRNSSYMPGRVVEAYSSAFIAKKHNDFVEDDCLMGPEAATLVMDGWRNKRPMPLVNFIDDINEQAQKLDGSDGSWARFRQYVLQRLGVGLPDRRPLTAMRNLCDDIVVIVDPGNGANFRSDSVYRKLGAKVIGIYDKPNEDGSYVHEPNPVKIENLRVLMETLSVALIIEDTISGINEDYEKKDCVGIAYDSDGDRLGVVRGELLKVDGEASSKFSELLRGVIKKNLQKYPDLKSLLNDLTITPAPHPTKEELKSRTAQLPYDVKLGGKAIARFFAVTTYGALDATTTLSVEEPGTGRRLTYVSEKSFVIPGDRLLAILAKDELETYGLGRNIACEVKGTTKMFVEYLTAIAKTIAKRDGIKGELRIEKRLFDDKNKELVSRDQALYKEVTYFYIGDTLIFSYSETKTGFAFVKEEMRMNSSIMAAEMSGHFFFSDARNWRADDSSFAAANLLARIAVARRYGVKGVCLKNGETLRTLKDLDEDIPSYPATPEMTLGTEKGTTPDQREEGYIKPIVRFLKERCGLNVSTIDGAKIIFTDDKGDWLGEALVRKSNNEPKLSGVRVWARSEEDLRRLQVDFIKTLLFICAEIKKPLYIEDDPYIREFIMPYLADGKVFSFKAEEKPLQGSPETQSPGKGGIRTRKTPVSGDDEAAANYVFEILDKTMAFIISEKEENVAELRAHIDQKYPNSSESEREAVYNGVLARVRSIRLKSRIPLQGVTAAEIGSVKGAGAARVNRDGALEFDNPELSGLYKDRGWHDFGYIVSRLYAGLVATDKWIYNVAYSMTHFGDLHAATVFGAFPLIPYTPIYQSTGSHSQGLALDIKLMRAPGIQQIPVFNANGELIRYRYMPLKPGDLAFSIPGSVDIFTVQMGGNQFADRSIPITPETAGKIAALLKERFGLNIDVNTLANGKLAENLPIKGMPYIFYRDENGNTSVAVHPDYKGRVGAPEWVRPFVPSSLAGLDIDLIFNPARIREYETSREKETLNSEALVMEVVERIMSVPETAPAPFIFTSSAQYKETAKLALSAYEALHGAIIMGGVKFEALLKEYPWGMPIGSAEKGMENFILRNMGAVSPEGEAVLAKKLELSPDKKIGESWIGKGRVGLGTKYPLPVEALSIWPDEIYSPEHLAQFGPESGITSKLLNAGTNLSIQKHGFPEKIVAFKKTTLYIGVSRDITKTEFIASLRRGDLSIFNKITLEEGESLTVPANCPHAYLKGTVVKEDKDIELDSPARTSSFYDRGRLTEAQLEALSSAVEKAAAEPAAIAELEGVVKTLTDQALIRKGKDVLTTPSETIEGIAQGIETAGYLKKLDVQKVKFVPVLMSNPATADKARIDVTGITTGSVGIRYTIREEESISADTLSLGSGQPLFVLEGAVMIKSENGNETRVGKGGQYVVPYSAGVYTLRAVEGEAVVMTQYRPIRAELIVTTAFQAMQNMRQEAKEGRRALKTFKLWAPVPQDQSRSLYKGSDFSDEARTIRQMTGERVVLAQYTSLDDLAKKSGFNPETDVVIALESDLKKAQGEENAAYRGSIAGVLRARMLPVPQKSIDAMAGKTLMYIREVEATGVILGNTDPEDIVSGNPSAQGVYLLNLIRQMTGKPISFDNLKGLLAADGSIDPKARVDELLKKLLLTMPIERYEIDEGLKGRRQTLWSV